MYEELMTPAPRDACTWDPAKPVPHDAHRVHLFFPVTRDYDGYQGWVDHLWFPVFDPVGPEAAIHDCLEHLPDQRRGVADEFMAQGASIFLRAQGGRFAKPEDLLGVVGPAWDLLARTILGSHERTEDPVCGFYGEPLRLHGDAELWLLRYLEIVHEQVTPRVAASFPHPAQGRRALAFAWDLAVPWMRAGYRVATERYAALGAEGARRYFPLAVQRFSREAADRTGPLAIKLDYIAGDITVTRPGHEVPRPAQVRGIA